MNEKYNCPRLFPLRILSRKWAYLVLKALQKEKTFTEILDELEVITNRALSLELQLLVNEGILVHVDHSYTLSKAGFDLLEALEPLAVWSEQYAHIKYCSLEQNCSDCSRYHDEIKHRLLKLSSGLNGKHKKPKS